MEINVSRKIVRQMPAMDLEALRKHILKKNMHFEQNFQLLYSWDQIEAL